MASRFSVTAHSARFDLAHFGELVGDLSRAAMLLALMDGSRRPASELAALAGVSASTASSHLKRLLDGGLLAVETLGRHRYFRIATDDVADALETIVIPAPRRIHAATPERLALEHARTCYRHLAGTLGVRWLRALERLQLLQWQEGTLQLSPKGEQRFASLGVAPGHWPRGKPCLDWTERKAHLGGKLGSLLTEHLFSLRWLARDKHGRSVRVTTTGRRQLELQFDIQIG